MHYRQLGRTGWKVSDISFGAWAIGGTWGSVSDDESVAALHKAVDCGVNFIDTADVYGDGRSERLIAQLKKSEKREIVVATKAGRRLPRQTVEGYSRQNLTMWVEDSLRNLATDSLDLLQLHCPPSALYDRPEVLGILDDLVGAGKIRYYGVSVEKIEEALKAIEFPNVQTVQIIFNCFRQRDKDRMLGMAVIAGIQFGFPLIEQCQRGPSVSDFVTQIIGDAAVGVDIAEVLAEAARKKPGGDGKILVMAAGQTAAVFAGLLGRRCGSGDRVVGREATPAERGSGCSRDLGVGAGHAIHSLKAPPETTETLSIVRTPREDKGAE